MFIKHKNRTINVEQINYTDRSGDALILHMNNGKDIFIHGKEEADAAEAAIEKYNRLGGITDAMVDAVKEYSKEIGDFIKNSQGAADEGEPVNFNQGGPNRTSLAGVLDTYNKVVESMPKLKKWYKSALEFFTSVEAKEELTEGDLANIRMYVEEFYNLTTPERA